MAPFKSTQSFSVGQFLRTFRNRDAVGPAALNSPVRSDRLILKATGGTKYVSPDGYTYHTFYANVPGPTYTKTPNTSETFVVEQSINVDYLIIGGGGAGGNTNGNNSGGGGGGAGVVRYLTSVSLSTATYPVTVGGGGDANSPPASNSVAISDGDASIFNSVTSAGGGAGSPAPGGPSGSASGADHPGSGNDLASPPVGWGNAGGAGGGDNSNLSGGGGGGGASTAGIVGQSGSNPPGYSQGGGGGLGASYTVVRAGTAQLTGIAGGGGGGGYSKAGVEPNAFNSGGGIQDFRNWDSPLLIYPTTSQRYTGLDGTGSGGTGGSGGATNSSVPGGSDPGGPPYVSNSGRGGCGLVQIRYVS